VDLLGRSPFALRVCAAAALPAGCGGGSQLGLSPIQQSAPQRLAPGRSPMSPEKNADLAYIGGYYGGVSAFTYPGLKYVYSISGVSDPAGMCSAKTGNWWVVASGSDEVSEYAHGGTKPLKTLSEDVGEAAGCTVDPTTGNLAVTILGTSNAVVFTGGSGSGTTLSDGLSSTYFAAYDDKGDLFVDGITSSDTYGLVELPKGGSSFETITLSPSLGFPGELQWHRNYLAIGGSGGIYHYAIHGTKGKEIGVTPGVGGFFWIQGRYVLGADAGNEDAVICKYPAGSPCKTLSGSFDLPIGVTVSVAK
jgi:hypothetical protein